MIIACLPKINSLKNITFSLGIILAFTVGCSSDEMQTVTNFTTTSFEDNFEIDGSINPSSWNYIVGNGCNLLAGCGWGNNELQYYTDRSSNIKVQDGMLHITAREEQFGGSAYTSARITTKGKVEQQYGRFEARIQLPWGQGLWPAFWLLSANIEEEEDSNPNTLVWPFCGEIDIMENRGQEPTLSHGSIHGPGYSGEEPISKTYDLGTDRFDTDFHIFGIEWGPEYINFYIDDVLYNQITPENLPDTIEPDWVAQQYPEPEYEGVWNNWVFDNQPFYIVMNLAVGGGFSGAPNSNTIFPQTMLVDWVRVYSRD